MIKRIILLVIAVFLGIVAIQSANTLKFKETPLVVEDVDHTHIHAGFQVYKDGELQDFSSLEFMDLTPCGTGEENPQQEKAHLHENVGDVVHVHRKGALWSDLFKNIKHPLEGGVEGYVNGEKINNILDHPINAFDSVIIFAGEHEEISEYASDAVTIEHIKDIESRSELCGTDSEDH